jgi:hypothetical protein
VYVCVCVCMCVCINIDHILERPWLMPQTSEFFTCVQNVLCRLCQIKKTF